MANQIEINQVRRLARDTRQELNRGGMGAVTRAIREAELGAYEQVLDILEPEEQLIYEGAEEEQ